LIEAHDSEKTIGQEEYPDKDKEVMTMPRFKLPKSKRRKVNARIKRIRKGRPLKKKP